MLLRLINGAGQRKVDLKILIKYKKEFPNRIPAPTFKICRRRSFHLLYIREKNCAVEFKIFNLRRTEPHWNANRKLKKLQIWKEYPDPPVHKNPQGPIQCLGSTPPMSARYPISLTHQGGVAGEKKNLCLQPNKS